MFEHRQGSQLPTAPFLNGLTFLLNMGMFHPVMIKKSSIVVLHRIIVLFFLSTLPVLSQSGKDNLISSAHAADSLWKSMTMSVNPLEISFGGIVRTDKRKKEIHLVFTGHEFGDGGEIIRKTLRIHHASGSFFLTGDFYRNAAYDSLIRGLKKDGHYLGGHSNKHLLYCDWDKRDSLLVSREEFLADLKANYTAMESFGVMKGDAKYFLPPYEWYNEAVSNWAREFGVTLINFTPGTYSNADWTIPELGKQYLTSDTIYSRILVYEKNHADGLNGFILLTHIGVDPKRTDKFYRRLDDLLTELEKRGYKFTSLKEGIPQ